MSTLHSIRIGSADPTRLARFWAVVLGRSVVTVQPARELLLAAPDDHEIAVSCYAADLAKDGQNRQHFDLTSRSLEDQQAVVDRALAAGGRHCDIGQDDDVTNVVLADPDGNEWCVIEPDNGFLADTGLIGCLACDGSQQVGYFWSVVLGWPLVWDQDQETAIQAPHGGTKISWGGPPVLPKPGSRNRIHLDIEAVDGDPVRERDRLIGLGASLIKLGPDPDGIWMADPDGNEFRLRFGS